MSLKSVLTLTLLSLAGCVTATSSGGDSLNDGGYFVALAAESGSEETLALYDGLHDAIDAYNRREADKVGRLSDYVKAFESDGLTRLEGGGSEIECDLSKCLVKLTGRTLTSGPKDDGALAAKLTDALAAKDLTPQRTGIGDEQRREYILGRKEGLHVSCEQRGVPPAASYRCVFDLVARKGNASAQAALDPAARGKLVSCALSPATARNAEEAKSELEGGALLELTAAESGQGAKPVGFLRYARTGATIELVDLFLCGDLSNDRFVIEGAAKAPKAWVAEPAKIGGEVGAIDSLRDDDILLAASSKVVEETSGAYVLEVRFKLILDPSAIGAPEVYGEDRFRLRVAKDWMR